MNADVAAIVKIQRLERYILLIMELPTIKFTGTIANTASMLYSNNLTTFITSLINDGEVNLADDDDILVGALKVLTSM